MNNPNTGKEVCQAKARTNADLETGRAIRDLREA